LEANSEETGRFVRRYCIFQFRSGKYISAGEGGLITNHYQNLLK
jgi:hypothetical protein